MIYLICLVGIVTGPLGLIVSVISGRPVLGIVALAVLALAGFCRLRLQPNERFASTSEALDAVVNGGVRSTERLNQLVTLLQQWDELEHRRGGPEFDPWAVQAIRREIHLTIREDPALERLFDSRLRT